VIRIEFGGAFARTFRRMNSQAHRRVLKYVFAAATLGVFAFAPLVIAEGSKPKYSIKEVMQAIHKGQDNVGKRAGQGVASKDDLAKLVEYYESLPLNEPPRGEMGSWKEKSANLVAASKALKAGSPGAAGLFKNAANCKACHNVHKPEEKK
jgi:cytochrome c553